MFRSDFLLVVATLLIVTAMLAFITMTPFLFVVADQETGQMAVGYVTPPKDPYYRFASGIDARGSIVLASIPGFVDRNTKKPVAYSEGNIKVYVDGIERRFLIHPKASRAQADLVFAVDSTESMENAIDGVKDSISELVNILALQRFDIRVGGIDFGDQVRTRINLSSEIKPFKAWLEKLGTKGGGDSPEGAIDAVINANMTMNWRAGSQRIIILLTNSTSHFKGEGGLKYESGNIRFIFTQPKYNLDDVFNLVSGSAVVHVASRDPVWRWVSGSGSNAQGIGGYGYDLGRIGSNSELGYGVDCSLIANYTGGVAMELSRSSKLDLTELPIESIMTQWTSLSIFANILDGKPHNVQIFIETEKGKSGMSSLMRYLPPSPVPFSAYLDRDKNYAIVGRSIDWLPCGFRIQENSPMIPLRWFCDQIGARLEHLKKENRFRLSWGNRIISVWPKKNVFYLDVSNANNLGTVTTTTNKIKTHPDFYGGSLLVPMDFIMQAFDSVSYTYDAKAGRLNISYPK